MKRSGSATHSGIDRDAVRVRRNGAIADGKKPRSAFVQAAFRDSEARGSPGNTARVGAVEPSSRTSSRRCAADDRPGLFRPRTARRRAARVRRALETARARARDRISPRAERRGGRRKNSASRVPETARRARPPSRTRDHASQAITRRRSIEVWSLEAIGASRRAESAQRGAPIASRDASRAAILEKAVTSKRASSRSRETRARAGRGDALVAVGLPHHHGVGVGGLAGGDHGGLVEDGGDSGESGHFDVRIKSARASARVTLSSQETRISRFLSSLEKAGRFLD